MEIPRESMKMNKGEEKGGWVVLDGEERRKEEHSGEIATAHLARDV